MASSHPCAKCGNFLFPAADITCFWCRRGAMERGATERGAEPEPEAPPKPKVRMTMDEMKRMLDAQKRTRRNIRKK
jgi:hypothetical protein